MAPAAPIAQTTVPPPASPAASSWSGDDSHYNPDGPERSRGGSGGKLDQQAIKDAITPHMGEVRYCFAREQEQNPELSGRVVVRFTISESGAVSASAVESSSVDSESVERCVVGAVRRWTFPAPKGGSVAVTWPFKVVNVR
jgi:TonB family protein